MTTAAARPAARPAAPALAAPARAADEPSKLASALGLACAMIAAGLGGAGFVDGFRLPVAAAPIETAMIPAGW